MIENRAHTATGHEENPEMLYQVSPDAIDCPLGDGLAVLDTRTSTCFSLNGSGAVVWNAARRPVPFFRLRDLLQASFADPADVDADLRRILSDLVSAGLFRTVPAVSVRTAST